MKSLLLLFLVLIFCSNNTSSFATQSQAQFEISDNVSSTHFIPTQYTKKNNEDSPDFAWIVGEIVLVIITGVILLIIYSWHLKKAVNSKTLELKNLNSHLEDKVEERTAELIKSKEEYKAMYAHAEEERKRGGIALKAEREAIKQNLNFIDMISHEYRTPLSVLSSSIELIQKKCKINQANYLDDQINKMQVAIKRLIDIFDSSLGKDRVDNRTPQLSIESLHPISIINSAIELTKTTFTSHNILFNATPSENLMIAGDEKLLVTVFCNILDNACKYSEPTTQINLTVNQKKDHIEIVTIDSGIGIDEDELPFVFEKYFRSEHTGTRQGAGIGLFIVKMIVELHNGKVKIKSRRNVGTVISVALPIEEKV